MASAELGALNARTVVAETRQEFAAERMDRRSAASSIFDFSLAAEAAKK
jgi:hypothetical protein